MILRPQQIYLLRMGLNKSMANMGGGGGTTQSQQSTETSTQLVNNVTSSDSRSVASDNAISIGGNENTVNRNTTSNFADSGNTTTTTTNTDNSVNNIDNSVKYNSNVSNTMSDFGSISKSLDSMKTTASAAMGNSYDVTMAAIQSMNGSNQMAGGVLDRLFTTVGTSSANSQGTAMQALGLANGIAAKASDAVTGADKQNKKMMYIAGAVVLAILVLRK